MAKEVDINGFRVFVDRDTDLKTPLYSFAPLLGYEPDDNEEVDAYSIVKLILQDRYPELVRELDWVKNNLESINGPETHASFLKTPWYFCFPQAPDGVKDFVNYRVLNGANAKRKPHDQIVSDGAFANTVQDVFRLLCKYGLPRVFHQAERESLANLTPYSTVGHWDPATLIIRYYETVPDILKCMLTRKITYGQIRNYYAYLNKVSGDTVEFEPFDIMHTNNQGYPTLSSSMEAKMYSADAIRNISEHDLVYMAYDNLWQCYKLVSPGEAQQVQYLFGFMAWVKGHEKRMVFGSDHVEGAFANAFHMIKHIIMGNTRCGVQGYYLNPPHKFFASLDFSRFDMSTLSLLPVIFLSAIYCSPIMNWGSIANGIIYAFTAPAYCSYDVMESKIDKTNPINKVMLTHNLKTANGSHISYSDGTLLYNKTPIECRWPKGVRRHGKNNDILRMQYFIPMQWHGLFSGSYITSICGNIANSFLVYLWMSENNISADELWHCWMGDDILLNTNDKRLSLPSFSNFLKQFHFTIHEDIEGWDRWHNYGVFLQMWYSQNGTRFPSMVRTLYNVFYFKKSFDFKAVGKYKNTDLLFRTMLIGKLSSLMFARMVPLTYMNFLIATAHLVRKRLVYAKIPITSLVGDYDIEKLDWFDKLKLGWDADFAAVAKWYMWNIVNDVKKKGSRKTQYPTYIDVDSMGDNNRGSFAYNERTANNYQFIPKTETILTVIDPDS